MFDDKESWKLLQGYDGYSIIYNITDTTGMDRSKWTEKEKAVTKNYICMLAVKIWSFALKGDVVSLDGKVIVLKFEGFDRLEDCQKWPKEYWSNRKQADWYKEYTNKMRDLVKPKYLEN